MKPLEENKSKMFLIQYMIQNRNKAKENLSDIYKILQKHTLVDIKVKEKWEKELEINISAEDW